MPGVLNEVIISPLGVTTITPGMYRGRADAAGREVALYSDAEER